MLREIWRMITGWMSSWYKTKMFIEHASVVSSDALHLLVGTLVWILVAALSRRSLASSFPWFALLAATLLNELVDLWVERWPDPAMQYGESAKDILLTMALPTILLLLVRTRPRLFSFGGRRR